MARFHRRGFRGRRSSTKSRKTYWSQAVWQGIRNFDTNFQTNVLSWVSFWSLWPSDRVEPDLGEVTAADVTLVRSLVRITGLISVTTFPVDFVLGLIAFDGGQLPDFYELGTFSNLSSVAPPNPATDGAEDWIIRIPLQAATGDNLDTPVGNLDASDLWNQTRAMRKLPPGKGILAVIGAINVLAGSDVIPFKWSYDARHAVKSGYTR